MCRLTIWLSMCCRCKRCPTRLERIYITLDPFSSFRRKPEPRGIGITRNVWVPAFAGMTICAPGRQYVRRDDNMCAGMTQGRPAPFGYALIEQRLLRVLDFLPIGIEIEQRRIVAVMTRDAMPPSRLTLQR